MFQIWFLDKFSELESSLIRFAGSDSTPIDMEAEGIKEREDGERVGGGGYYCKHFHQSGVFIQGRQLIEGRDTFLIKSYFFFQQNHYISRNFCAATKMTKKETRK